MSIFAPEGKLATTLNCIGNLIVLNILTMLCCLPVVTAGAAMTALYTMTMRIARDEEGSIIKGYFQAFKENFRQATALWLFFGGLILFLGFDIYILRGLQGDFGQIYRCLLFVILLGTATVTVHVFVFTARFENTALNTARNALFIMLGHLPQAVLMLAVTVSPLLLLSVSFRFISVVFLIGISGPAYLASLYFKVLLRPYEGAEPV